jgi:hypothetical protein
VNNEILHCIYNRFLPWEEEMSLLDDDKFLSNLMLGNEYCLSFTIDYSKISTVPSHILRKCGLSNSYYDPDANTSTPVIKYKYALTSFLIDCSSIKVFRINQYRLQIMFILAKDDQIGNLNNVLITFGKDSTGWITPFFALNFKNEFTVPIFSNTGCDMFNGALEIILTRN